MKELRKAGEKAILVLGMHRSGTSALTRVLSLLGVELGGNFLKSGPDNRLGFWEHADAVALHERLLHALDRTWNDTRPLPPGWESASAAQNAKREIVELIRRDFSGSRLWAIKDPRICRLAPLWIDSAKSLGIDLRALFVVRQPDEVANSLKDRDGMPIATGKLSWMEHFAEAEYATRKLTRSIVLYAQLLTDWKTTMGRVSSELGVEWPKSIEYAAPAVAAFLDEGQRHHSIDFPIAMDSSDVSRKLFARSVALAETKGSWGEISKVVDDFRLVSPIILEELASARDYAATLAARAVTAEDLVQAHEDKLRASEEAVKDAERRVYGLLETVHGKDMHIQNREERIRERDAEIDRRDKTIGHRQHDMERLQDGIRERDRKLAEFEQLVLQKDAQLLRHERDTQVKEEQTQSLRELLLFKERQFEALREAAFHNDRLMDDVGEKSRSMEERVRALAETVRNGETSVEMLSKELGNQADRLRDSESAVRQMEDNRRLLISAQENRDAENVKAVVERDELISFLREKLSAGDAAIAGLREKLDLNIECVRAQEDSARVAEGHLREMSRQLAERSDRLRAQEASTGQLQDAQATLEDSINKQKCLSDRYATKIADLSRSKDQIQIDVDELRKRLAEANQLLAASEMNVAELLSSTSWRVTSPIRAIKTMFKPSARRGAVKQGDLHDVVDGDCSLGKAMSGSDASVTHDNSNDALTISTENADSTAVLSRALPIRLAGRAIPILTTHHCVYVAREIGAALENIGVQIEIIHARPDKGYADVPHFVICPNMFDDLPGLYVSFQMEQSVSSRWFTPEYLRKLENSFAILDYSLDNIEKLQEFGLYPKQIYHAPIDYVHDYADRPSNGSYDYDVLFYGDIQNDRRRHFIAELEKVCRVRVHNDLFGEALHDEIARARLVVNIHYYEGALLETTRLWECLALGKLTISERSSDMHQHHEMEKFIDFVDVGDVNAMVVRVKYWLDKPEARAQREKDIARDLQRRPNRFNYHFYRFLLATDNIDFEEFWNLAGKYTELAGDKLCLNLPEYVERSRSFDRDNSFGFSRFVGLRHSLGWLGCAMSYKLMIRLARQRKLDMLTICEDDVEFISGFSGTWSKLSRHLQATQGSWDIFSGIMANLHDDAVIRNHYNEEGIDYIETDRLISMVFNVYSSRVFDLVDSWDASERDPNTNTIDRFLEEHASLKVLTTAPFLVGHKEELHSTLWGFQNTQYRDLISESRSLLSRKLEDFHSRASVK